MKIYTIKPKQGHSLATLLMLSLFSFQTNASVLTNEKENLVTGENGVADGYNNIVTSHKGQAQGNDSISTGGNVSRDEFKLKLSNYEDLLNQRNQKKNELLATNTGLDANNQTQANITNQIQNLNQLIDSARQKSTQLDNYNSQLNGRNSELTNLQATLEEAKRNANATSATGSGDKTLWTDFTAQLGKLNWNQLSDSSGGTTGVNKVATQLKSMIENDYTEFTDKWSVDKYEEVINGYINRQGLFDANEDRIGLIISNQIIKNNYSYINESKENMSPKLSLFANDLSGKPIPKGSVILNKNYLLDYDEYVFQGYGIGEDINGKYFLREINSLNNVVEAQYGAYSLYYDAKTNTGGGQTNSLPNYLESLSRNLTNKDIDINYIFEADMISLFSKNIDEGKNLYSVYNLDRIYKKRNIISEVASKYENLAYKLSAYSLMGNNYDAPYSANSRNIITVFKLPPIKQNEKSIPAFVFTNNLEKFVTDTFKNELASVDNGIISDQNVKAFISNTDIDYLRQWTGFFYDHWYNKIDMNASSDKWLFDENEWKQQMVKIEGFAHQLKDYVAAYDKAIANPKDTQAQIDLITLYNKIREQKDDKSNYYEYINVTLKPETLKVWNDEAEKTAAQLTEWAKELKLYDARNEIIKGVLTEAQGLKDNIDKAQKAVEDKQKEIDGINKQIANLALTPDEQGAADVKAQKQKELEAAQKAKEQLEKDKIEREKELEEINRKIKETELANLGENSITYGTNAFASGNNSIAFGTNATAQHQNAIAIGKDTLVTGDSSIAIGYNSQVTGKQSIAIGVGHRVSGNNSTTIGDPNEVTGNNAFVAGNNNVVKSDNVMVVGNNVNIGTGFNGAVAIGDVATVASANPYLSHKIAGTTYQFAGNPTAVFSVGAAGKERQLTNVAAGRISETSTDGINGSQLYAVISSLNQLSIGGNSSNANINLEAGNHIAIQTEGDKTIISSTLTGGNGIQLDNNAISIKQGDGLTIDEQGTLKANVGKGILIDNDGRLTAKGTKITAGENIQVTGDETSGYTISTKTTLTEKQLQDLSAELETKMAAIQDTNTQSVTKEGNGVTVEASDNTQGTKDYTVSIKNGDGLTFDEKGNLQVNPNIIKEGENIAIQGNVKEGFVISAKVPTVSQDKGIEIVSSPNQNGSTDYKIKAKLGRGLAFNDKGEIIATTQALNSGDGVTIIEKGGESTIKVEGVTTKTDDGMVLKRQDLTESLNLRGGKNIKTTTEGSDIKIHLVDDIEVNSLQAKNGASIQRGLNMNNSRIVNVADGQDENDAINVRQLNQAIISTHNRFDNKVNQLQQAIAKQNKQRKAGQASSLATAGLMQAFRAGQSGITAAVGQYQGQSAVAVGYSSLSNNGKLGIKFSLSTNSQKEFGGTIGGGYFW